jgi:hypothetical protein
MKGGTVSEALGRVEKPAAELFRNRRKLLLVFLVYPYDGAPSGYTERCERYWRQIAEQIASLEAKIGPVKHVYHESVYEAGEQGLELVQKLNRYSHEISRVRSDSGASLEAFEERELAAELSDLGRFLMLGFASSKVAQLVRDMHTQAEKKRNQHVVQVIDRTLQPDEVGLLFASEGHGLQFPVDIEVFSVVPPALDELHRWLRDESARLQQRAATEAEQPSGDEEVVESGDGAKEVA